jgi:hypothetical protein
VNGTNGVTVNGAKVTSADIACSNGVIHVTTRVLLPAKPVVFRPAPAVARRSALSCRFASPRRKRS